MSRPLLELARLLWRQNRGWVLTWVALAGGLSAAALPMYASTYATEQDRAAAVEQAQHEAAAVVLYGRLASPGTTGQMFNWELGTFLTLIAATMAVLLAVRLTRRLDEDGTLELVRSVGLSSHHPPAAAVACLGFVGALLGLACAVATGAYAGRVAGVDWPGAATLGLVVALTFAVVGMSTAAIAQVVPSSRAAASLGGSLVAIGVVVRAVGDLSHSADLRWVSPMALRSVADPFDGDHIRALLPALVEVLLLATVAVWLGARRDLGGSLLRPASRRPTRLHAQTTYGLVWRLTRSRLCWTTGLVGAGGVGFALLGSGTVENARRGRIGGGFLGAQLAGHDPAAAYDAYTGTVLALVVAAVAVTLVIQAVADETHGLAEHVRATGVSPSALPRAYLLTAMAGSLVVLAVTGLVTAVTADLVLAQSSAFGATIDGVLGQWPAVAAVASGAGVIAAVAPRVSWLAWLPLVVGGSLTLLGGLMRLPGALIDLSMFGHTTYGVAPTNGYGPELAILALAMVGVLATSVAVGRRDLA